MKRNSSRINDLRFTVFQLFRCRNPNNCYLLIQLITLSVELKLFDMLAWNVVQSHRSQRIWCQHIKEVLTWLSLSRNDGGYCVYSVRSQAYPAASILLRTHCRCSRMAMEYGKSRTNKKQRANWMGEPTHRHTDVDCAQIQYN